MSEHPGTRVTCEDLETGESDSAVVRNNWMVVTDGDCEVTSEQHYGNGTSVLTIKRPLAVRETPASDAKETE